jgi:uncharacterized membrane protein YeaQ/YmgE (transglycosylase-associated protein family)
MAMGLFDLILWVVFGAIAGWLTGLILKGYGFGVIGNIGVGIVGGIIAGSLLPLIGFVLASGFLGGIINAVIGAVFLVLVIGFVKRAT